MAAHPSSQRSSPHARRRIPSPGGSGLASQFPSPPAMMDASPPNLPFAASPPSLEASSNVSSGTSGDNVARGGGGARSAASSSRGGSSGSGSGNSKLRQHRHHRPRSSHNRMLSQSRKALMENDAMVYLDGPQVYTCGNCRTHLTSHDDIISKSFHGRHGKLCSFAFDAAISGACAGAGV